MCKPPTPAELEQERRIYELLRTTPPVELAARLVQATDELERIKPPRAKRNSGTATIHQTRWIIPDLALRNTSLWDLTSAIAQARHGYLNAQPQTGAAPADDAITVSLEGRDLVLSFESHSGAATTPAPVPRS